RDERTKALSSIVTDLVNMEEAQKTMAGEMSGLAIHYDLGPGHPLLGRRMPDLDIETANGPMRVFTLLHEAKPVLLTFGASTRIVSDSVRTVDGRYEGKWEL